MPTLKTAIEGLLQNKRPVSVLYADAEKLTHKIAPLVHPRSVVLCDCRYSLPDQPTLESIFKSALYEDKVLLVAIRNFIHPRLFHTLNCVIMDENFPGSQERGKDTNIKGLVVLCTTTHRLSDIKSSVHSLPPQLSELFPGIVGTENHNVPWLPPPRRQAVVFIHGIGEPRAMASINQFARTVLPEPEEGDWQYRSSPEESSPEFRRLEAKTEWKWKGANDEYSPTNCVDFFEYYWGDKVTNTTIRDVIIWIKRLLFNKPTSTLLPWWLVSWGVIFIGLIAAILGIFDPLVSLSRSDSFGVGLLSFLILGSLHTILILYLGDAARYLEPNPGNISSRTQIKDGGADLLQKLMEKRTSQGEQYYDRLVVVGHSLGSVIAYDIIRRLWEIKYWKEYDSDPPKHDQQALHDLKDNCKFTKEDITKNRNILKTYQKQQLRLWQELKVLGSSWIITDLITLGSPLAHGDFLIPNRNERIRTGEFPTNPPKPYPNMGGQWWFKVRSPSLSRGSFEPYVVGQTGVFAFTRWTNLYFPTRLGVLGDFLGGRLGPLFGYGILDQAVSSSNPLRKNTPWAHTSYLSGDKKNRCQSLNNDNGERHDPPLALDALKEALDLQGRCLESGDDSEKK